MDIVDYISYVNISITFFKTSIRLTYCYQKKYIINYNITNNYIEGTNHIHFE